MRILQIILFIILIIPAIGQTAGNAVVQLVDENGRPVRNAAIYYGDDRLNDTAYTSKKGRATIPCITQFKSSYSFHIRRQGFLPHSFFADVFPGARITIALRSRKGFWYNARSIDSTHLGITVREAIARYKLDINECLLWDEPPGNYHNFTTELGDSSYVRFTFRGIFNREKRLRMTDVLDRIIIGIGIGFSDGTEKEIGAGYAEENPYRVEHRMKENR